MTATTDPSKSTGRTVKWMTAPCGAAMTPSGIPQSLHQKIDLASSHPKLWKTGCTLINLNKETKMNARSLEDLATFLPIEGDT